MLCTFLNPEDVQRRLEGSHFLITPKVSTTIQEEVTLFENQK